jgi:hypoxanthine phosphoribosyltransferase
MSERLVTLLSAEQIASRVRELGAQITEDYKDKGVVLVLVLKGSFVFGADLARAVDLHDCRIDFLATRSYGERTESSGVVQITHDLSQPIEGKDVLIVEDIVDTGLTLGHLLDLLHTRKPRSIRVCSLLHKPSRARVTIKIDYLGFTIEDKFVVGYGLDWAERYRNVPFIGVVERSLGHAGCSAEPARARRRGVAFAGGRGYKGAVSKRLALLEKMTASGKADSFAWYGLALEYRSLDRLDDALRTFETLRASDPAYVPMYLMAGQVLLKAGRPDDARAWLNEGIVKAKEKHDSHALSEIEGLLAELDV